MPKYNQTVNISGPQPAQEPAQVDAAADAVVVMVIAVPPTLPIPYLSDKARAMHKRFTLHWSISQVTKINDTACLYTIRRCRHLLTAAIHIQETTSRV